MENKNYKLEKDSRKLMFCCFCLMFGFVTLYVLSNNLQDTYSASAACEANLANAQPGAYCSYLSADHDNLPSGTEILVDSCNSDGICTCYPAGGGMVAVPLSKIRDKGNYSVPDNSGQNSNQDSVQNTTNNNPETGVTISYVIFILAIIAGGYSIYYFNKTSKVS